MVPPRKRSPRVFFVRTTLFLIASTLAVQAFWLVPDSLVVVEYPLAPSSWPAALDGFTIAAVGDLHGGAPFVDVVKLEEVVLRISAAKPDLIAWLGDYVIDTVPGGTFMEPEKVAAILARAKARYGQIAVIGNHDRWLGAERVERAFRAAGVTFLRWQSDTLLVNGVRLHVSGLDDFDLSPDYWPRFRQIQAEWRGLPKAEPLVVLSHNPDVFPFLPPRVTLTLASHTHGGQLRLPVIGSPIVPSSFGQRFSRGHIVEEGRHLFVNTGIGTSILPVRFGVRPEISILKLIATDAVAPQS